MTHRTMLYGAPGTGKTAELIRRIVADIDDGALLDEVMAVSFTRAAAEEQRERVEKALGVAPRTMRHFQTIHAMCFKLIQDEFAGQYQVVMDKHRKEFAGQHGMLKVVQQKNVNPDDDGLYFSGEAIDFFVLYQMMWGRFPYEDPKKAVRYLDLPPGFRIERFLEFCEQWPEFKANYRDKGGPQPLLDFIDMPRLVLERKLTPDGMAIQYYDEHQDVFPIIHLVAKQWMEEADKVVVAGDPYQTLYEWAGSNPRLFMDFARDETVVLAKSHRLPKRHWQLALEIAKRLPNYFPDDKPVWSVTADERECRLQRFGWRHLGETATRLERAGEDLLVIARTNEQVRRIAHELARHGCSFQVLRKKGARYGWPRHAARLLNAWFNFRDGRPLPLNQVKALVKHSKPASQYWVRGGVTALSSSTKRTLTEWDIKLYLKVPWERLWEGILDGLDDEPRLAIKNRLRWGMMVFDDERRRTTRIGTIHAAKGREADTVILVDSVGAKVAKTMRTQRGYHDNCRTFYVAATRARHNLFITRDPKSRHHFPMKIPGAIV